MPANRRLKRTLKISGAKAARKARRVADEKAEAFVEGIDDGIKKAVAHTGQAFSPAHILAKAGMYVKQIGQALEGLRAEKAGGV